MEITCVNAVFFSAAGNTKKVVTELAGRVAGLRKVPLEICNFTLPQDRISQGYDEKQLVIFGTPVYAGRIPNKLLHPKVLLQLDRGEVRDKLQGKVQEKVKHLINLQNLLKSLNLRKQRNDSNS